MTVKYTLKQFKCQLDFQTKIDSAKPPQMFSFFHISILRQCAKNFLQFQSQKFPSNRVRRRGLPHAHTLEKTNAGEIHQNIKTCKMCLVGRFLP